MTELAPSPEVKSALLDEEEDDEDDEEEDDEEEDDEDEEEAELNDAEEGYLDDYDEDDDDEDEVHNQEEEQLPPSSWEDQFARLQAFHRLTGHCRVPKMFSGDKAKLGPFVHQQRVEYRKFILRQELSSLSLTQERIDRLNSIDFDWMMNTEKRAPALASASATASSSLTEVAVAAALSAEAVEEGNAAAWQEKFELLSSFYSENGHTRVPKYMVGDTKGLGPWVDTLRKQAKKLIFGEKTTLTMEQVDQLNKLRFEWNLKKAPPVSNESSWQQKFELLRGFQRVHGHCRVPPSYVVGSTRLGNWVASQRRFHKMNAEGTAKLAQDRIDKLNAVGFEWSILDLTNSRSPTLHQTG